MRVILFIVVLFILASIASCIITQYNWRMGSELRRYEEARYRSTYLLAETLRKYRLETGRIPENLSEAQALYELRYKPYQGSGMPVLPFNEITGCYNAEASDGIIFTWPGKGKKTRDIWITRTLELRYEDNE